MLLRETYRAEGKVKKRTLANLSALPTEVIEGLKVLLRGGAAISSGEEVLTIERSLPHGHVAAVLGSARACGASAWFDAAPAHLRPTLMAVLVARILDPASKLATRRMLCADTAANSLGRVLGVENPGRAMTMRHSIGVSAKIKHTAASRRRDSENHFSVVVAFA